MKTFHALKFPTLLASIAAAAALTHPAAVADTAVSNLGNFHNGNFGITNENFFMRGRAQSFTTGSTPFVFEAAILSLSSIGASGDDGFQVYLYSNGVNNLPGSVLLALEGTEAPLVSGEYTFTAPSEFELAPQTTYWIATQLPLNQPDTMSFAWTFTVNSAETGLPGWSMGSSSEGTSFMGSTPNWTPGSVPLRMSVEVSPVPVPEPGTAFALALSAVGLLATRRRYLHRA
jgi:hypothetical protein